MRKNTMRAALMLLVLVLVTSCFVGGTFAKYVTEVEADDSARVAYWGFKNPAAISFDIFDHDDAGIEENALLAPGSENSVEFGFAYTTNAESTVPEVDYEFVVDLDITGSNTTELDQCTTFKWTLGKKDETATEYNTLAELQKAVRALSGDDTDGKCEYEAGILPDAFTDADETYVIGWKWAFNGDDVDDTALGNMDSLENVKLAITVSATQLDNYTAPVTQVD